jgi:hypothetical protein
MSNATTKTERKKPKLVRESFTIPKNEYLAIDTLKTRAIALGSSVKKSELLRAGLLALQSMTDPQFKLAIAAVPQLKTGRPAADPGDKAAAPVASAAKTVAAPVKPKAVTPRVVGKAANKAAPAPARKAATPAKRAVARPASSTPKSGN